MVFYIYQINYNHLEVNLSNQYSLRPGYFGHTDLGERSFFFFFNQET